MDLPWNEETDQEDGGDSRSVLFLDFSVSLKPTPHPLRGCRFAQVSCCNPLSVQMWGLITADCLWAHEGSTLLAALKGERHTERERGQSASCIHLGDQLFSYWSYISRYISPIWFMLKVITRSNFTHDVMQQRVWCMLAECWCLQTDGSHLVGMQRTCCRCKRNIGLQRPPSAKIGISNTPMRWGHVVGCSGNCCPSCLPVG